MMFNDREQTPREPETLPEVFYSLTLLLHYYTTALLLLLVSFCIDIALLVAALCGHLGEGMADVVEACLQRTDHCEACAGEAKHQATRLPAPLLWAWGCIFLLGGLAQWCWAFWWLSSTHQPLAMAALAIPLLAALMASPWLFSCEEHRPLEEIEHFASPDGEDQVTTPT